MATGRSGSGAAAGRPLRLLVVDDHEDSVTAIAALLETWGHEVRVARDGESALEAAPPFQPEVVLLDLRLPGIDGFEVARRLRAEGRTERPTLVALSGMGREEDLVRCREAGFDHHLLKPVAPEALRDFLARLAP